MRRRLLTLAAAAATAAGAAVVASGLLSPAHDDPADVMAACMPEELAIYQSTEFNVQQCLDDALTDTVNEQGVMDALGWLAITLDRNPNLEIFCHRAGHVAGLQADINRDQLSDMLADSRLQVCDWTLLHGYAEAYAATGPSDDDLSVLLDVCDAQRGHQASTCAETLGHVLWEERPDLDNAPVYCAELSADKHRQWCGYGILMQKWRPVTGPPDAEPGYDPDRLPAICEDWPVPGYGGQAGCGAGAAYAALEDSGRAIGQLKARIESGEDLPDNWLESLNEPFSDGIDLCVRLRDDIARFHCLDSLANDVARAARGSRAIYQTWCELLPDEPAIDCNDQPYWEGQRPV